jgi:hypothetical protein
MRIASLCLLAGFASGLCSAQPALCGINVHPAGKSANDAFDDIRKAAHLPEGVYFLYQTSDPLIEEYGGAAAIGCWIGNANQRWIVYDPNLIKGDLALHFALAHELAHHEHNDSLSGEDRSEKQELEADWSAAEHLASAPLSWTKEKILEALSALSLPPGGRGVHPSLANRTEQVVAGYEAVTSFRPQPGPNPIPPPTKPKPDIGSFTASLSTVTKGNSTTLRWGIENAESAKITTDSSDDDVGEVNSSRGSARVYPTEDQTYTLTAVGPGGDRVTATVRVRVRGASGPTPREPASTGSHCMDPNTRIIWCAGEPRPLGSPCGCLGIVGTGVVVP